MTNKEIVAKSFKLVRKFINTQKNKRWLAPCRRFRPAATLEIVLLVVLGIILTTTFINSSSSFNDESSNVAAGDGSAFEEYTDKEVIESMQVDHTYDDTDIVKEYEGEDGHKNNKEDEKKEKEEDDEANESERERDIKNEKEVKRARRKMVMNAEYRNRISLANDYCLKRPSGKVERILFDTERTVSTCVVPKVGCTHWINIFRFINNKTNGVEYNTPSEIPRWITHYGEEMLEATLRHQRSSYDPRYYRQISFIGDTSRFMFVRHPIRRLWSAWVDKFILPDFWFTEGVYVADYLKLPSTTRICPTNITFNQFLRFVTHSHFMREPEDSNTHWRPIQQLCDPCVFRPHFIGKMETFSEDSRLVLSAMNIEPYLEKRRMRQMRTKLNPGDGQELENGSINQTASETNRQESTSLPDAIWFDSLFKKDRAVHEMTMLTNYNLQWMNVKRYLVYAKGCGITKLFVAERLWKAFQINGYIRSSIDFPMVQWDEWEWHRQLFKAYQTWPTGKEDRHSRQRDQKESFLRTAYTRIPLTTLLKIKDLFLFDFRQFGYSFDPW